MIALLALLAGCASPHAPEAHGHPTIVSLNPCTDAILAEVADPLQILAISHYSHDPRATSMGIAAARRFRATGGTVEEILALDPDVVIGSIFMAPSTRGALEGLGLRVETVGMATSVAESLEQVRAIARIAGHPERGEALAARIERSLGAKAGGAPVTAVFWQPGGIVPGEDELITELMARAGFASHSAIRGMRQADYLPLERVLADPPGVLIVAGAERSQQHPALAAVPGLHRAAFDPALLYCGGPTIVPAMERLREIRTRIPPVSRPVETSGANVSRLPAAPSARYERGKGGRS